MSELKEKTIVEESGGHFYAEHSSQGWAVYQDGGTKKYSDGSTSMGLNIPVVLVSEWVAQEQHQHVCEEISKALNEASNEATLTTENAKLREALEECHAFFGQLYESGVSLPEAGEQHLDRVSYMVAKVVNPEVVNND